ncbi:site-specific integrase [Azospirillum tabaci]|uniref:site-specific integrase n=1 Tax=Azospirillum tabaci TaxID=2752310 RepID=UPI001661221A|nr:site-specific integrase [Azospirillum tabaci]
MATIETRGPDRFRAKVRVKGHSLNKTFATRRAAAEWARIQEGRILGKEYRDLGLAERTSLAEAIDWYRANVLDRRCADAKNKDSKLLYWLSTEFADWSLVSLHAWDLIRWRKRVLDEASPHPRPKGAPGPRAEVGPQTVVHRLNVLSQVYKKWQLAHRVALVNPVVEGVRPSVPNGRDRRLQNGEEERLLEAAARSAHSWLRAAIVIAMETAMRQAEQADLVWRRIHLDAPEPYLHLVATKNGRPRIVPLSTRAHAAFRALRPAAGGAPDPDAKVFPVGSPRSLARAFDEVATEADFPDLRWHDLRHEATSRLFERTNLRDSEIMAITGHLRPEMLVRYTHLRTIKLGPRLG